MTLAFSATLVGLGFIGAFASGLIGIGGAVVMVPLLYYVPPLLKVGSLDIRLVTGVTMAQVLAAALVGAWTHGRRAMVHRTLALTGGTAMALGSLVGGIGSRFVGGSVLLAAFAAMATLALPLMFVSPVPVPEGASGTSVPFGRAPAIAYPAAIGLMAGLVGAGGAFLLVPVLIGLVRIPVRPTIGTSLAMTGMSAATGFLGKLLTGQVPAGPAALVVMGSLAGAALGARVSWRVPVALLRGILAAIVALVALGVWADVLLR